MTEPGGAENLAGLRILIVEDEMMLAMLMEDWLAMLNCQVATASRVDEAVALVASGHFDGALLDVNLAGERVYPVAEALAKRDIPFIFMTGYSTDMLREDYSGHPAVRKPFQLEEIEPMMIKAFGT
ncbi:MAG TPA: response regulator [Gammaproteobacteria bacterium]|nr:response regulator [Gammaproteobacteria bacterium]